MGRLAEILGASVDPDEGPHPRWNIAPSSDLMTPDLAGAGSRTVSRRRWGPVPHWANDPSIGSRLANARSETAWDKPSFRDAMRRGRCIVPIDGFYEWAPATPDGPRTRTGRPAKRPHLFRSADGSPLLLAAIGIFGGAMLAVTDDDRTNMLAAVRAKAEGCAMAIALSDDDGCVWAV